MHVGRGRAGRSESRHVHAAEYVRADGDGRRPVGRRAAARALIEAPDRKAATAAKTLTLFDAVSPGRRGNSARPGWRTTGSGIPGSGPFGDSSEGQNVSRAPN